MELRANHSGGESKGSSDLAEAAYAVSTARGAGSLSGRKASSAYLRSVDFSSCQTWTDRRDNGRLKINVLESGVQGLESEANPFFFGS